MSQELERVYTINLGKVLLSQSQHRAVRAINMIREFARHHMKVETIKIEEELAHQVWARGVRSPPRKIRVRMSKTDEGYVLVSRYDEEIETPKVDDKVEKAETPKVDDKVEKAETPKVDDKVEKAETPKVDDKVEKAETPKVDDKVEKAETPKVDDKVEKAETPKVDDKVEKEIKKESKKQ